MTYAGEAMGFTEWHACKAERYLVIGMLVGVGVAWFSEIRKKGSTEVDVLWYSLTRSSPENGLT